MDDFIDVSETKTNTGYNFSLIERYATDLTKKHITQIHLLQEIKN